MPLLWASLGRSVLARTAEALTLETALRAFWEADHLEFIKNFVLLP